MPNITFVTLEKVLEMRENEEDFALVDTLSEDHFKKEHIPGAINIPAEKISREAASKIDRDKPVVTYCACYVCPASTTAAEELIKAGYLHVMDFKGGLDVWEKAGFGVES